MIEVVKSKSMIKFQKQLNSILKKCKISRNQLSKETGITPTSLFQYSRGLFMPSIKTLIKLQKFCDKKGLKIKLKKDW